MKRALQVDRTELYHYGNPGRRIPGIHTGLTGTAGDFLVGDCSRLTGELSPYLHGDCTGLSGDVTGISGNIDDCELTEEERAFGFSIARLIADKEQA